MTATHNRPYQVERPSTRADQIGRVLMGVDALLTLGALATGFALVAASDDAHLLTEMWRTLGYIIFAGLWAIIAVQPRRQWGIWELLLVHKVAITAFALFNLNVEGGLQHVLIDGWLVVSTGLAYVLCRGWQAWRPLLQVPSQP
ncbi:hypothetical protein Sme01_14450 [Sphaerisporangium melleum]|uniref:Uncharacterized protein n=1 Tax=Sphaerisporangium melleum TaxID=321316 RepID=A0A917VEG9_9ACTN|nr:hypothetical protein [Sphaerisporangium melleum]GGK69093.1 hypothetical protein GCM10007964_10050 [Sphaerisporangium melleum]GII68969.1 hypothetical protein Sme01_14450 [Sphaerisporangium melleum]